MDTPPRAAGMQLGKLDLSGMQRHAFLCVGPDCCAGEEGLRVWECLKAEIRSRGLPVLRSKAGCLRICSGGPWLLIYPEGIWYGAVDEERCRRIVAQHLQQGRPVDEWIAARHPLPGGEPRPAAPQP